MRNVTLLVAAISASLLLKTAAGSAIFLNELSSSSEEVGVNYIRNGQHQCAPGICCPQYLTCFWGWTQFYCSFKSTLKWTRKQPAFAC